MHVQLTLYVHAPLQISRAVYGVSQISGLHLKCRYECTYRVQFKCTHQGTVFLMYTVNGKKGTFGVDVDYTTFAICAPVVQSS